MNAPGSPHEVAQELFRQKQERRRRLAALSFEEKIAVLVRLQQLCSEIAREARGQLRQPWKLEE